MPAIALDDVVSITQSLVQIPSVNPMGRDVSGPTFFEGQLTEFLATQFCQLGLPFERHEVLPGRENLITRVGRGQRGVILLEVHQDTVPVDHMTIDPFGAEIRQGRLFGRGACDVKGGMAAMIHVLARWAREAPADSPDLVLACTVNEENGFDGAKHLRSLWQSGKSQLLPFAPDIAIVAEPTCLNVVIAHKGTVRWRCHTRGRAAHSSSPGLGVNAVYAMAKVLAQLDDYAARHVSALGDHHLVGQPTLSVGMIEGGLSVNTVPDRCTILIDRRLLPDETGTQARDHVIQFLQSRVHGVDVQHEPPFLDAPGLADRYNRALAKALADVIQPSHVGGAIVGVPFGTNASTLAEPDLPIVVFGPGDVAQAHTKDEWIDLEQLRAAAEILYAFCRSTDPRQLRANTQPS